MRGRIGHTPITTNHACLPPSGKSSLHTTASSEPRSAVPSLSLGKSFKDTAGSFSLNACMGGILLQREFRSGFYASFRSESVMQDSFDFFLVLAVVIGSF